MKVSQGIKQGFLLSKRIRFKKKKKKKRGGGGGEESISSKTSSDQGWFSEQGLLWLDRLLGVQCLVHHFAYV